LPLEAKALTDGLMPEKIPLPAPGRRLRDAWAAGPIAVPGAFNALTAKLAERLGFRAVYLSGGALSAAFGVPDVGLLTLTEFADEARRLAAATTLPLLCDADTGFGEALNVERTVQVLEGAGAAGIHLEDQLFPKRCGHLSGKALVEPEVMAAKVRAAVAAKRDPAFVVIARTDARGVTNFDDAVRRANLYLEAGADAIFPEAMESADEFARFAREVRAPLLANMTEFGKGPLLTVAELGAMGYRMVLYPLTAFRAAMKAAEETLRTLHDAGHQRDAVPRMLTRAELYDLLGYTGYEERDRAYFGG
jgi:methylisocitrate lyase